MSRINDATSVVRWAIESGIKNYGIEEPDDLLDSIMDALHEKIGGGDFYLPRVNPKAREQRDRRIKLEYDGTNASALRVKYGLCRSTLSRILRNSTNLP